MDPRLSRSEQPHLREIALDLPCAPCGRRTCPLGHHDCMRLVTVDDVGRSVLALLDAAGPAAARVA
jgi:ADP-heptose:LPS heptosyltransferase